MRAKHGSSISNEVRRFKRCTSCVLPEHYPGIEFDEVGVCNYCRNYKKRRYRGEGELDTLFESLRNKDGEYDCVVGISGGRDSSYALHYLVKVCNLRVLALTADNGFIPEEAKVSMKRMTDKLGVELVVYEHDLLKRCIKNNVSALLRNPVPQMVQMMCCGCRLGIGRGLFGCAKENQIPLVAVGGGTPVEICYYKRAFFNTNLFFRKSEPLLMVLGLAYQMASNPFYLKPASTGVFMKEFFYYFTAGIRGLVYPDQHLVRLYRYIEWDEDEILATIKSELDWKQSADSASSWRADCRVSFLKNYLLSEGFGFTEKDDYFSNMIREGMITREEALERLGNEAPVPQRVVDDLLDEIGIDPASLRAALEKARRNTFSRRSGHA